MAEQSEENVVNQAKSVDESSSIGAPGTSYNTTGAGGVDGREQDLKIASDNTTDATDDTQTTSSNLEIPQEEPSTHNQENIRPGSDDPGSAQGGSGKQQEPIVNGENGSYDGSEDIGYQHSASDETVLSDADAVKIEGGEQSMVDGKVDRAGALKRPTTFKPVSVTKNFLAKSAAGATINSKPTGDKGMSRLECLVGSC